MERGLIGIEKSNPHLYLHRIISNSCPLTLFELKTGSNPSPRSETGASVQSPN
uniref:Uncharacterized protein n=1 Tax=Utricularia reniformis TaxID=192314 RepID=A0A1Y0B4K9_9LAMI|nr:hypothetical protein AEK19_MT2181 [Utricularia reniformis]ART32328.1 hypothetical protein AEK19_MT2181 [Utricularia reniformis]